MAAQQVDYEALASQVLDAVGGEANVQALTHCATRLRFVLKDGTKADLDTLKAVPGVITAVKGGGQHQVVIGNDVARVFQAIMGATGLAGGAEAPEETEGPRDRNLFNRLIGLISGIFSPIIWVLAAMGLFKAIVSLLMNTGVLVEGTDEHTILNGLSDGFMYLLPMALAVTSAQRFKVNPFTSMAIAGFLVYPQVVALYDADRDIQFFGVPVIAMSYVYSVVPIIVAVWVQSFLEPWLLKILPGWLRNFTTPLLVVLIIGLGTYLTIGPIVTFLAAGAANGVSWLLSVSPALGGFILGGLYQVFVIFGLHWGLLPLQLNDLANFGHSLIFGPLVAAVLAQSAAAAAVAIRTKDKKLRQVAGPASVSGFVAGVTEPIVYGVNLPLKRPFIFGLLGGAVGGGIAASGGSAATSFILPSLLTLPSYLGQGNFLLQVIGDAAAVVIAFGLTLAFGLPRRGPEAEPAAATGPAAESAASGAATEDVVSPVGGTPIALQDVDDPVFSSGSMGTGIAIDPTSGHITSPVEGTVITAMKSGHAYGLRSITGVEVLVHIGIDTVQLEGRHFTPHVQQGDQVAIGQPPADVNLDSVRAAGYDPTVLMIVTNSRQFPTVEPILDEQTSRGELAIMISRSTDDEQE